MLTGLARDGLLVQHGSERGMVYFLPCLQQSTGSFVGRGAEPVAFAQLAIPLDLGAIPPELRALPLIIFW